MNNALQAYQEIFDFGKIDDFIELSVDIGRLIPRMAPLR